MCLKSWKQINKKMIQIRRKKCQEKNREINANCLDLVLMHKNESSWHNITFHSAKSFVIRSRCPIQSDSCTCTSYLRRHEMNESRAMVCVRPNQNLSEWRAFNVFSWCHYFRYKHKVKTKSDCIHGNRQLQFVCIVYTRSGCVPISARTHQQSYHQLNGVMLRPMARQTYTQTHLEFFFSSRTGTIQAIQQSLTTVVWFQLRENRIIEVCSSVE